MITRNYYYTATVTDYAEGRIVRKKSFHGIASRRSLFPDPQKVIDSIPVGIRTDESVSPRSNISVTAFNRV